MAEHEGLGRAFREKLISLDTMERRLLLPTAVAIALVIAVGVLLATRDLPWPLVSSGIVAGAGGAVAAVVPLPIAVLAGITLVMAWSYVLAGALHAHLAYRVVGVAAYALMALVSAHEVNSFPATQIIYLAVFAVVVAAVGLWVADRGNHRQAPHLHHRTRLRGPTFVWVLLVTALIYGLLASAGARSGEFVTLITFQLTSLQNLLIPVLVLAGTDFAEWSEVVSGRLASVLERFPRPVLVIALVVAGAGVLAWVHFAEGMGAAFLGRVLAPVAVLAIPVGAVGLWSVRRAPSTRVPFWALGVGAVFIVVGLAAGAWVEVVTQDTAPAAPGLPPLVAVTHQADPAFHLEVPQGWAEASVPGGWMWSGTVDGRSSRLVLLQSPLDGDRALSQALAAPVELGPKGTTQGWTAYSMTAPTEDGTAEGQAWTRDAGDGTWVLAGVRAGGSTHASATLFEAVRTSWSPEVQSGQDGERRLLVAVVIAYAAVAAVLLALGLALLAAGRGEVATAGLFLTLCGLFTAGGTPVAGVAANLLGVPALTLSVSPANLLLGMALAAPVVAALSMALPRHRLPKPVLRLLLVLVGGLAGLEVLQLGVFNSAEAAGERFSVVAGVVLVAAMLWDVLMSGESFTNRGGLVAPRHTRVLIYLGYTLMVVTAVLFLGSVQAPGGGGVGLEFSSESWPEYGIQTLGPALLLTFFLVNLGAWRRGGRMGRADGLDQVDRSALAE